MFGRGLGVGTRLMLLVALFSTVLVAIGGLGLWGMAKSNDNMDEVYQEHVTPLRGLKIIADMYAVNIVDTTHKVRNGNISWAEARKNMAEAEDAIKKEWHIFTTGYQDDEEKKLIAEAEPKLKEADTVLLELKDILIKEDHAAVAEFAAKKLYPAIDPIGDKIAKLIDVQLVEAKAVYDASSQKYALLRNVSFVTIVLCVIFGFGFGVLIVRSVTRPLGGEPHEAVAVFDRIAMGDLAVDVPVRKGDNRSLMAAARRMQENLRAMLVELREASAGIAAAAQTMSSAGADVERSSGAQAEAASIVAAAIEQTSVSISETATNARIADETASETRSNIETTLSAVRETAGNVESLAGMIADASDDVARLAESSRQIAGIVQTIKDIADQTDLLALNAAIEAARAGEQGRGFAVVADEVRKLAESTTKATKEISDLIGGVQSEVDVAVSRMQSANSTAETTRERVVASSGALDAASANTGRVTESLRSIADAVREQDVAVQQVAQRVEQIAQMTEQNTTTAATAADTARHLDSLAVKLRDAVGRFKV